MTQLSRVKLGCEFSVYSPCEDRLKSPILFWSHGPAGRSYDHGRDSQADGPQARGYSAHSPDARAVATPQPGPELSATRESPPA
jgi:hypothetical protein